MGAKIIVKSATLRSPGDCLLVESPYYPPFAAGAKKARGKWNETAQKWQFFANDREVVESLLIQHYGTTGSDNAPLVSVKITACGEVSEYTEPVLALGRVIAKAWGRDTGAKTGTEVAMVSGEIGSGGSMKNWKTIIQGGAVFLLHDVALPLVERFAAEQEEKGENRDWSVEILTPTLGWIPPALGWIPPALGWIPPALGGFSPDTGSTIAPSPEPTAVEPEPEHEGFGMRTIEIPAPLAPFISSLLAGYERAATRPDKAEGAISFLYCDGQTGHWIVVDEGEQVPNLVNAMTEGYLSVDEDGTVGITTNCKG